MAMQGAEGCWQGAGPGFFPGTDILGSLGAGTEQAGQPRRPEAGHGHPELGAEPQRLAAASSPLSTGRGVRTRPQEARSQGCCRGRRAPEEEGALVAPARRRPRGQRDSSTARLLLAAVSRKTMARAVQGFAGRPLSRASRGAASGPARHLPGPGSRGGCHPAGPRCLRGRASGRCGSSLLREPGQSPQLLSLDGPGSDVQPGGHAADAGPWGSAPSPGTMPGLAPAGTSWLRAGGQGAIRNSRALPEPRGVRQPCGFARGFLSRPRPSVPAALELSTC